jgi:4-amino-4-deoxy-L-arabinose transferase-like glycosyltransferase
MAFFAAQVAIACMAANGPFVDEALYTVAGIRVLEGEGRADGYVTWFNGSPFVWPVIAAAGHHVAGLTGARLLAVALSTIALWCFSRTAVALVGERAAAWSTGAFAMNGLFLAFAHFAVYDVPALAALALAMWAAVRPAHRSWRRWVIVAALAFAIAVACKYAYVLMAPPLAALLAANGERRHLAARLALFCGVAALVVAAYFQAVFGSPFPASTAAYFEQTFRRTRDHIAVLQLVFGFVPLVLAGSGALLVWRRRPALAVAGVLALAIYPAFHLWTSNFVSGQKHVVAGFLFAYLLAGVALDRLWRAQAVLALGALAALAVWGVVQWHWQEHSWSDARPLTRRLAQEIRPGERVIAESSWIYILALYPGGLIASPSDVVDANFSPRVADADACGVTWLVGNPETAPSIGEIARRCGHRPLLSSSSRQYYFDTRRLRLDVFTTAVTLYRLPDRPSAR